MEVKKFIRRTGLSYWGVGDPVTFLHYKNDHWAKMRIKVPSCMISMPLEKEISKGCSVGYVETTGRYHYDPDKIFLGPVPAHNDPLFGNAQGTFQGAMPRGVSPDLTRYKNKYSERAKKGYIYWPVEGYNPYSQKSFQRKHH
ncbi:uncharacterized protein LOC102364845 [Latimeria chalumnae]|uniref:uncharacterized protein LOC102364845 n=1 Tax=Latimeria chalumnae TaxID=7897 RepID=UPI0006D9007B|nr:PREDICTED: uncharacterized protein LOC102364845 isoform X2 [Latimeria chalumnae]|eukprot:XP_014349473.1 PREDICTED: uncharacterized protein LOC102364845 isoform X2 [Latimeria chalumnae]